VAVYLCLRYYAVRSWRRSDRWLIMPAALSLALKVREAPKPIAHVIAEFEKRRWRDYERARPGEPRRAYDRAYIDGLKEPFCVAERAILFATGFQFGIGDPYPHVAKQLHALGLRDEAGAPRARSAKTEVQQMAFCFLRDRCVAAAVVVVVVVGGGGMF
jgi:cyclin T